MNGMDLVSKSGFEIRRFQDLSAPYQMAIIWYMAFDGEAWATIDYPDNAPFFDKEFAKSTIVAALPKYVAAHAETLFGVSVFSLHDVKEAVMAGAEIGGDFESWESYHKWYIGGEDVQEYAHDCRWPAIVSGFDDEVFQDGWHRMHSYARSGHKDIPVVFYPEEHHLCQQAA